MEEEAIVIIQIMQENAENSIKTVVERSFLPGQTGSGRPAASPSQLHPRDHCWRY
jgi:hypothetical protein